MVPVSGHYSWEKGMKVLGLGTANLVPIQVDDHMRMDVGHLRESLERALEDRTPVLGVVGMLGSTEFGTFDPIHEIVAARDEMRPRGLDFGIHVDGAWGGYLTSVFRDGSGEFVDRDRLRAEFRYFPSHTVYEAFRAIGRTDSVTVDPHKLGYVPYPAGAFVARNREVVDFITQQAAYVFDLGDQPDKQRPREKLRSLGQYILEGSKPGAAAASVWVTHRVLPLDGDGLGRLLKVTIRATEEFWDSARVMTERLADRVHLCVPFEPDSNLICLALNPVGNRDLGVMNRFGRRVFSRMRVDPTEPVQIKRFIASYTSLSHDKLPGEESHRILEALDIDPATFVGVPEDDARESDHIFILRHTLMNPWLLDGPEARSYIEMYWDHLEGLIDEALADRDEWTFPGETR
jgi:glutamate/tyrosine decarboxylase-like PLP-dependent enzyme